MYKYLESPDMKSNLYLQKIFIAKKLREGHNETLPPSG